MAEEKPQKAAIEVGGETTFMSEPNEPSDSRLRLKILSDPAELGTLRAEVEQFVLGIGFDAPAANEVVLAMDEALTNIIRHAYQGATDKPIEIELDGRGGQLKVVLRDFGRRAEKAKIRSRDLDDVRPGGLGVYLMNKCMDSVEYAPAEGGGTRLTMKRSIKPSINTRTES